MKHFILLLLLGSVANALFAQTPIITTIAGTGTSGYSGDGGPAVFAQLGGPEGISLDDTGNLYIADPVNYRIRKINLSGIITTVVGNGAGGYSGDGGPALMAGIVPRDVAVDNIGNLYFADNSYLIRKVNTSGIISTIAGIYGATTSTGDGGPATAATLRSSKLALDGFGSIYVTDWNFARVRMINSWGIISTVAGNGTHGSWGDGGPATDAQINNPVGIHVDDSGNFYFTSVEWGTVAAGRNLVRKVDYNGIITRVAGNEVPAYSGDGGPATNAELNSPLDVTKDWAGNLYIADRTNGRIRKINTSGIISTIAGTGVYGYSGDGGPASAAQLYYPNSIAVDDTGNIYFSDGGNFTIRKISIGNHMPTTAAGHFITLHVCKDSTLHLNLPLAATDVDAGQVLSWTLVTPPSNGTALIAYSAVATGGVVTPSGLQYTPVAGFTGADLFKVRIDDGTSQFLVNVGVLVDASKPTAAPITGTASLCPGDTAVLHNITTGGSWSSSSTSIASVTAGGVVTALTPGTDTIRYVLSNSCGSDTAKLVLTVKPLSLCPTAVGQNAAPRALTLQPNPSRDKCRFLLSTPTEEDVHITISNALGQLFTILDWHTNKPVDISTSLPAGVYTVTAITTGERYMAKLVVE